VGDADQQAIALLTEFSTIAEHLALTAYKDPLSLDGKPVTNGYGSTRNEKGLPWIEGEVIEPHRAIALLKRDVTEAYWPCQSIPYWQSLNAHQRAALADLNFNEGYTYGDGDHDSLDLALKLQEYGRIGTILQLYDNNDQLGLSRRRYAEWLLWCGEAPSVAYELAWAENSVAQTVTTLTATCYACSGSPSENFDEAIT
jgi:GH24 family phage-related lysozyme (muramidase)